MLRKKNVIISFWNVGQQVCQFKMSNDKVLHVFLGKYRRAVVYVPTVRFNATEKYSYHFKKDNVSMPNELGYAPKTWPVILKNVLVNFRSCLVEMTME